MVNKKTQPPAKERQGNVCGTTPRAVLHTAPPAACTDQPIDFERLSASLVCVTLAQEQIAEKYSTLRRKTMNGRKAIVGLCMLCALVFSAVAAQSASAAGTTAYTCVKDVNGTLWGEHCLGSQNGSADKYKHEAIELNKTTEVTITNEKTENETKAASLQVYKGTIAGIEVELSATGVHGVGTLTNREDAATKEMYVEGTAFLEYTGVKVTKPAVGCTASTDNLVTGAVGEAGKIDAHMDFGTKGQGDRLKFSAAASTAPSVNIWAYYVTCSPEKPGIEGTSPVTGSFTCPTNGATIVCTHLDTTAQNSLKFKGAKGGLEGSLTVLGRANSGEAYKPISLTT
jgi:hypothetical protein